MTDTFYPQIASVFKDKNNCRKFINIVSKYIDTNTERLSTTGPVKKILFTYSDRNSVYDLTGVSEKNIEMVAKQIKELSRGVNASNPFNILLFLMIRYFHINKLEAERKSASIYLILSMYPSIHAKYFKFEPNENIMSFTVNSLSNKYKIKQQGTLLATLVDMVEIADNHYKNIIVRGNDKDIADYISAVKTRLNQFMKNITTEFMKQHASGRYLNYDTDNEDPDNFSVADNNSLVIDRISTSVSTNLAVKGPDQKSVMLSAKMNKISVNDLRSTMNSICRDKVNRPKIREIISCILYEFLFTGQYSEQDIYDMKFTLYSSVIYKRSNTTRSNIVRIKNILDFWIKEYSSIYKKSNLVSTLNQFRRAIFMFFIFTIQQTK
jgi:hypothetical protein